MTRSSGARWVRGALQVNPFLYEGRNSAQNDPAFSSEDDFNKQFVEECLKLNIELLAITDHWNYRNSENLAHLARSKGICVLPGFEANSQEGIHILVIFPESTSRDDIERIIATCGGQVGKSGTGTATFDEIVETATAEGALAIPAHANVPNSSLFIASHGESLQQKVKNPKVLAIGITPSHPETRDQQAIMANRRPFNRANPLSFIHADDVSKPMGLSENGATSWFRMSKVGFDGLALALRTGETRVRVCQPEPFNGANLCSLEWKGGFLDGETVEIADDLTALIGGRGSGKSTVIESIRFALGQEPIGGNAKKDFESFISDVLGTGAQVTLEVQGAGALAPIYRVKRTVGSLPSVFDETDQELPLEVSDLVGDIDIFGQHELAEIATDSEYVTQLVERRYLKSTFDEQTRKLQEQLADNRETLLHLRSARLKAGEDASELEDLNRRLDHFKEQGMEEKLSLKTTIEDQRALLSGFAQSGAGLREQLASLSQTVKQLPVVDAGEEQNSSEIVESVRKIRERLVEGFESSVKALNETLREFDRTVENLKADLEQSAKHAEDQIAEVERQLAEQGAQVNSFNQTKSRLRELGDASARLAELTRESKRAQESRQKLKDELRDLMKQRRKSLKIACTEGTNASGQLINLRLTSGSQVREVKNLIAAEVGPRSKRIFDYIDSDQFNVDDFVRALRDGPEALATIGLSAGQAEKLAAKGEELALQIEEIPNSDQVTILLKVDSTGPNDPYKPIDSLSKGQRATTLLLLLLAQADGILVLDQPEDDLDNHFIYSGVVRKMRELKNKRQLIVGTHNANIPVLGDAEQIVCLDADGRRGRVLTAGTGSIDNSVVRTHVEKILEGGKEAFAKRSFLYGF